MLGLPATPGPLPKLSRTSASVFWTLLTGCDLFFRMTSILFAAELNRCVLCLNVAFSHSESVPSYGLVPVVNWKATVSSAYDVVVISSCSYLVLSVVPFNAGPGPTQRFEQSRCIRPCVVVRVRFLPVCLILSLPYSRRWCGGLPSASPIAM